MNPKLAGFNTSASGHAATQESIPSRRRDLPPRLPRCQESACVQSGRVKSDLLSEDVFTQEITTTTLLPTEHMSTNGTPGAPTISRTDSPRKK